MIPFVYEKEADTANYIYFKKYRVTDEWTPDIFPHYHDSIEFVFMTGGENRIHINTQEETVRADRRSTSACMSSTLRPARWETRSPYPCMVGRHL